MADPHHINAVVNAARLAVGDGGACRCKHCRGLIESIETVARLAEVVAERDTLKAENERLQADLILLADDHRKLKDGAHVLLGTIRECPAHWLDPEEWECVCESQGTRACGYHILVHAGLIEDREIADDVGE